MNAGNPSIQNTMEEQFVFKLESRFFLISDDTRSIIISISINVEWNTILLPSIRQTALEPLSLRDACTKSTSVY